MSENKIILTSDYGSTSKIFNDTHFIVKKNSIAYESKINKDEIIEKIQKIEDFNDFNDQGYDIVSNKQRIELRIELKTQCCEHPGYFSTNDNIKDFVGAKLLNIRAIGFDKKIPKEKMLLPHLKCLIYLLKKVILFL